MSSPTSGEEWISLHEAAQILNMKPSEMAAKLMTIDDKGGSLVRMQNSGERLRLNKSDVLAMRVQE